MTATPPFLPWAQVEAALTLLAVDPAGLGGLWLRARAGPLRDRALAGLEALPLAPLRLHPGAGDDVLDGGLDLAATLAAGRQVRRPGLLAQGAPVMLAMAERCPPGLAARLGQWLDAGGGPVIALDEGAAGDELLPPALADRLGLFLDLDGLGLADSRVMRPDTARIAAARERLAGVEVPPALAQAVVAAAAELGIASLRAPILALAVARASAAFRGTAAVGQDDLTLAAGLALAHRATRIPDPPQAQDPPPPPPPPQEGGEGEGAPPPDPAALPAEILLEAARAALPADVLARLAAGRAARGAMGASGSGAGLRGNRRGRPLPARPGMPGGPNRLDPVATLRAAAPWQTIRRAEAAPHPAFTPRVLIRRRDFRLRRFLQTSDRCLIFAVDASGSAAFARLAEAKGAVEVLLAQAYARRDHVALVAFRGKGAEVLLPPTRSLVQTRRRLAGLPGGGGTPLAAGLDAAAALARAAHGRGMTPTLALLTDGRANIARDGTADRARAGDEAAQAARRIAAEGWPALVIDTAARPQAPLQALAGAMRATYLPLPRADARAMGAALSAALSG